MKIKGNMRDDGEDGRGFRDGMVFVGTILALLLVMSLTPDRLMQAVGAMVIGIAGYFIPPRPNKSLLLYVAALLVFAACWALGDRIWAELHILWRH
jgi:hypothetical protein